MTRVDGQENADGNDHPAEPNHQWQCQPPPLTQLAHVVFAPRLQARDQEEKRHQP